MTTGRKILDGIKRNQPIAFTGAIRHMYLWATSPSGDQIYKNPNWNKKDNVAIYCIHGTADKVSAFTDITQDLPKLLPPHISVIRVIDFQGRWQGKSIEEHAEQVITKAKAYDDKNILIIGHSRGGLVGVDAAIKLLETKDTNVLSIITIGTPFHGSSFALPPLTWLSTSVKQMQIGSNYLETLRSQMEKLPVQYFHYASENDSLVHIDSAHAQTDTLPTVLERNHGHLSMLSSDKMVESISENIMQVIEHYDSNYQSPLQNPFNRIYLKRCKEIEDLKSRFHFKSSDYKEQVLNRFKEHFNLLRWGERPDIYPNAKSIKDFIEAFLEDSTICNNTKVKEILNSPLTFSAFHSAPLSNVFIESLIKHYGDINLPELGNDQYIKMDKNITLDNCSSKLGQS